MPENLDSWLTAKQVAERLGVSGVYSHKLLCMGRIRAIKTPLGYLVDPTSVEAYIAQRQAGGRRTWNARWGQRRERRK